MSIPHADRLTRLTVLLAEWQAVWRPLPFQSRRPPWAGHLPGLEQALLALSDEACERLQAAPCGTSPLAAWLPVAELGELVDLPDLAGGDAGLPASWSQHVGGRKWQQIEAFVPRVALAPGQSLVEWCAGKGHLARTLARWHGTEVTALEWQPALCDEGQALADRQGVAVHLEARDVLAPDVARWLTPDTHVAALHACGDLHVRLLELAAASGCGVTLAPCCYQRTAAEHYRPLSRLGRDLAGRQGLELSRDDLALAVRETVTAPRHVRRSRERAGAWRLGFDLLQRELRGRDDYLPVPSLAYGRLPETFAGFCRWAAERKGLTLPASVDWGAYERGGRRRQAEVRRLELVRHLFRRPLEVWLALDRLQLLEEAGFTVALGTFCERELTPRNLLLRASLPARACGTRTPPS
ncbi:SAM-dependent methyltransferase [Halomonas sp. EGI 63088]|uniref:SAM-dependent methyltransferase n=1 Tax=Halomonas flagellata TaxID=2920385 RepID=A0ABS9RP82_9GAMM|nr:methyltransferase [Halomonas flagellata]MCH4561796.1 SAM-dependent methyltransferase [Halomonas flagellata]